MTIADNIRHEMGSKGRRREGADNDTTRRALHVGGSHMRKGFIGGSCASGIITTTDYSKTTTTCDTDYIWNSVGVVGHNGIPCGANTIRRRSAYGYCPVSATTDNTTTTITNTTTTGHHRYDCCAIWRMDGSDGRGVTTERGRSDVEMLDSCEGSAFRTFRP